VDGRWQNQERRVRRRRRQPLERRRRRSDCGSTDERPAAANKDDRCAEIECRCTKQRTDTDIEDSHAPSHTKNICGDFNAERGIKDVLCGCYNNNQAEHPRSALSPWI
jgi:hypothetical protein